MLQATNPNVRSGKNAAAKVTMEVQAEEAKLNLLSSTFQEELKEDEASAKPTVQSITRLAGIFGGEAWEDVLKEIARNRQECVEDEIDE